MKRLFVPAAAIAAVLLWAGGVARANQITVTTSHPPGSPLVVPPGTTASATMFVRAFADTTPASPGPADRMLAWQLRLQIVPDAGATGTLTFNNPTASTPPNPPNYVFASSAGIAATKSAGNTVLDANDFDDAPSGTVVPTAPGANLLAVDFAASAAAAGSFGVFAVPGADATVWTDGVPTSRAFLNVPFAGPAVRIGSVTVVPEPGAASLVLAAGTAATLLRRRRGAAH